MLDPANFTRMYPGRRMPLGSTEYVALLTPKSSTNKRQQLITNEDLIVAAPVALGFSFSRKLWLELALSSIKEVEWSSQPLDEVDQPLGDLIVSQSRATSVASIGQMADFGIGLNIAVHGSTGTGKTLTAKGLVEGLRRPLYTMTTGDLSFDAESLEHSLQDVVTLVSRWNAILLIENVDVFVEARQPHDYHRNAIVSAFLQFMDLNRGALLMTPRCLEHLDDAFLGRLHFGIDCRNLGTRQREELWQQQLHSLELTEVTTEYVSSWGSVLSDEDLAQLGRLKLSARQVWLFA
jgi:hypothetical protein